MSESVTFLGVRVFDGEQLGPPTDVHVVGGLIAAVAGPRARRIDGANGVLIAGFVDAHAHVDSTDQLDRMVSVGITTVLDMGAPSTERLNTLRALPGRPRVYSALAPASAPGAFPTTRAGFDPSTVVRGPKDAERAVADRIAAGADYLKIIVEDPRIPPNAALDVPTIAALTAAARARGLRSVAHASAYVAVRNALDGGVDVLTHVPLDRPIDDALAARIAAAGVPVVPTLIMMRGVAQAVSRLRPGAVHYDNAVASVAALHAAGVTIAAGTDANPGVAVPNRVEHGESLHEELELLVDAGLSATQALSAATRVAPAIFELADRGAVEPGRRADLVLLGGDPTRRIGATRDIRGVWVGGDPVRG